MRRFELILVFGELFAVGWPAVFGVRPRRGIVPVTLVALLALHWQIEGLRWQMIPVYASALGLAIGDVIAWERKLEWTRRISRGLFGVAGIAIAATLPLILPVPELPVPSGPGSIGTVTVELVDSEREEVYGNDPGGPRRLMAQVWYPAADVQGLAPVRWSEDWDVVAPAMSLRLGLPGWFLNHTRYVESHATSLPPLADGAFPVVIYSHGWTGFRSIAINQIETLVSNGYIVISLDHTYGAIATRFPDGEVATLDPEALPDEDLVAADVYDQAAETLVEVFSGDIITALDALEMGPDGPFGLIAESADLTRVGLYGHSSGGGAAVRACLEDERCDAVLGLDAWVEPIPDRVLAGSAGFPAMFLRSDGWRGTENDAVLRGIAERGTATTYWLGVEGAAHNDFLVTPLLSPLGDQLGLTGPIPAGRIIPIVDRYLVGFFDVFLLGTGPAAIDTASFPEVSVEVIRAGE